MEASAVHAPAAPRLSLGGPLLRLRSDEQLVALFRAGNQDAFTVIHDRYRQRLFAYVRQMLSGASRQDAEDVMQDVFMRAYGALRKDERELNLKAWLYRVAHNRCIDHVRRPVPPAAEIFETSRSPLVDPLETAQRRDDLRRLVGDVGRLPEQQRSALLMREIDGLAYADIAEVLGVTLPAVKSLLVRARVGLAEAAEAREADCAVIRADLAASYDRGVKASARARRHMRECSGCAEFKTSLRTMRAQFAALSPIAVAGPLALAAKALGIGGASSAGGAAGGAAGGGAAAAVASATAGKVAAVVCTAALATGGAVEVKKRVAPEGSAKPAAAQPAAAAPAGASAAHAAPAPRPVDLAVIRRRTDPGPVAAPAPASERRRPAPAPVAALPSAPVAGAPTVPGGATTPGTGGASAPSDAPAGAPGAGPADGGTGSGTGTGSPGGGAGAPTTPPGTGSGAPTGGSAQVPATGGGASPDGSAESPQSGGGAPPSSH